MTGRDANPGDVPVGPRRASARLGSGRRPAPGREEPGMTYELRYLIAYSDGGSGMRHHVLPL